MPRSGLRDGPARISATPTPKETACTEQGADWSSTFSGLLTSASPDGSSSKTYRASSPPTAGKPLSQLSTRLKKAGIWGGGQRVTLSTLVSPKTVVESSLSQVLEATVPITSLLTAANCAGILRREERNGREVPPQMREALENTIRLWCNVGEALGTPREAMFAPRYAPKLESIREVTPTGQYSVARHLTWRECERLMGFPDDWTVVEADS